MDEADREVAYINSRTCMVTPAPPPPPKKDEDDNNKGWWKLAWEDIQSFFTCQACNNNYSLK